MSASKDLVEIRMKLTGQREVVSGSKASSKAIKEVGKAAEKTSVTAKTASRVNSGLTRSYKQLGSAAKWGLGFLGVGGVLAIESSINATEELSKTTTGLVRNMGLSTEAASRWGAVAMAREIDSKQLGMAMGTLGRHFVEAAHKGGSALTPFHQLGISQEEVAKGAHNTNEAILIAAKAFGKAEGGPVRQAAAMGLLGKAWSTVLPLMSDGTEGLKEQLHWADEYGVTLNGHTNEAIMEMVMAQRENKVAMLGLQVSLTKALMPAIHAGDEQLQEFIQTLNDPNLSAEQKISRISHQFLMLEDDLVHLLEQALPHIAEQGGRLGVALAGAIWHSFIHSDTLGKLAIGAWLFNTMGGFSAIGRLGAKVGGKLATSLGWKFLETVAPYFAAETGVEGLGAAMAARMPALSAEFAVFGATLGTAMGVAVVAAGAAYVVTHQEDILEALGADTNHGMLSGTSREMEALQLREAGYKILPFGPNGNVINTITPGGSHEQFVRQGKHWSPANKHGKAFHFNPPPGAGTKIVTPAHAHVPRRVQLERAPSALRAKNGGHPGPIVIHHKTILDGKVIAENTTKHALEEAALG